MRLLLLLICLTMFSIPSLGDVVSTIPAREDSAPSGEQFLRATAKFGHHNREKAILEQLLSGNMPNFLRKLKPITTTFTSGSESYEITFYVTPDYLSLGSDSNHTIIPMALPTATSFARRYGFVLPTPRMVDLIYQNAELVHAPKSIPPSREMVTNAWYLKHQEMINANRDYFATTNLLVAGHKKDVVSCKILSSRASKMAIYGWHRTNAKPIQPLSTVHHRSYVDYSHGIRLVSKWIKVNNRWTSIYQLMGHERLAYAVSHEGPFNLSKFMGFPNDSEIDQDLLLASSF